MLDDDPPVRPHIGVRSVRKLTAAEREERRYDPDDDSVEGDSDFQHGDGGGEVEEVKAPPQPPRPIQGQVSQRPTVRPVPAAPPVSSRQGGLGGHYQQLRSTSLHDTSFTHAFPALPFDPPASSRLPLELSSSSSSNPFSTSAPERGVVTTVESSWRSKASSSSSSRPPFLSDSEVTSPYFHDVMEEARRKERQTAPHIPPHRQHELQSTEEKQLWGMFDRAKRDQRTSGPSYNSHRVPPAPASPPPTGKPKRSLPLRLFDSVAVREEEKHDRERRKRKSAHPLIEERRQLKRLRAPTATHPSSSSSHRPPIPPPLPIPPPHHSSSSAPPKPARRTQLLVDPRVAAVEEQRLARQSKAAHDRLVQQRLKPSLDELHAAILSWSPFQLEGAVKEGLERRFMRVPLTFKDDVEYQQVFYPLLLEECRAEMVAALDEVDSAMQERQEEGKRGSSDNFDPKGLLEVVAISEYQQITAFHHIDVERVDFSSSAKSPALFTNDDLVLLWYRPSSSDPFEADDWKTASLYTLARLERVHDKGEEKGKGEKRKRGIRYKLQVHPQRGSDSDVSSQQLLKFLTSRGNQWGMMKVITLITLHRQYRALESCALLPLFPWLKDPASVPQARTSKAALASAVRQLPSALTAAFNVSQREAMATALEATAGITLLQGPPGTGQLSHRSYPPPITLRSTAAHLSSNSLVYCPLSFSGKTRTIVGLINLLLVQGPTPFSSSSSVTPRPPSNVTARILICAPSNAAIDEIVGRLLHPQALCDLKGKALHPRIVRIGAGKRNVDRVRGAVKPQHNSTNVDSVSLDNLVSARMNAKEETSLHADDRAGQKRAEGDRKDAAFYDAALTTVKEQLDEVHNRLADLEERKNALPPAVIHLDAAPTADPSAPPAENDVHQQMTVAHRQRKAFLAERKRLHEKKDEWFNAQRRHQQAVMDNKDALRLAILNEAAVVCTTLTGAGLELFTQSTQPFDCVIIDEAAQAIELQTLIPLKYDCRRFVLVGDDQQLSATVISTVATRFSYQQSLFSRLRQCGVGVQVIHIQYRMHPEIRAFPSRHFYSNQLEDAVEVLQSDVVQRHPSLLHALSSSSPADNRIDRRLAPYVFYDVKGTESRGGRSSLHNVIEAKVALEVFCLIRRAYQRTHPSPTPSDFISRVGVITPYQQQVSTLRRAFRDAFASDATLAPLIPMLEISTVDSFQGREKDFIIFSAVRAHQHDRGHGGIGFVADAHRLNVALTRAKQCLMLLGCVRTLGKEGVWKAVIDDARDRDCVVEVGEDIRQVFTDPLHHPRWCKPLNPSMWGYGNEVRADTTPSPPPPSDASPAKPRRTLSTSSRLPRADVESPSLPHKSRPAPSPLPSSTSPTTQHDGGRKKEVVVPPKRVQVPAPTPMSPPLPGGRMKPPSPSSLNTNAISIKTMHSPISSEERKDRPPPPTLHLSKVTTPPNAETSPSSSLRHVGLSALMKSSVNPIAGLRSTARSGPPPPGEGSVKSGPVKPKRTLSQSSSSSPSLSPSTPSTPVASPAVKTPQQGAVAKPATSSASSSPSPVSKASSSVSTARGSPPTAAPSSARRSPSLTPAPSPRPAEEKKRKRPRPRDEVDISGSAPMDDDDEEVLITSSHIAAPSHVEMEDGELPPSPPSPSRSPYLETVRGSARAALPAYSCEDCREFHRLIDRSQESGAKGRYQPQTFEMACNHRIRQSVNSAQGTQCRTASVCAHVALCLCCVMLCSLPPSSPPDYWTISTPPDPRDASQ